jgi:hypothetical protein
MTLCRENPKKAISKALLELICDVNKITEHQVNIYKLYLSNIYPLHIYNIYMHWYIYIWIRNWNIKNHAD